MSRNTKNLLFEIFTVLFVLLALILQIFTLYGGVVTNSTSRIITSSIFIPLLDLCLAFDIFTLIKCARRVIRERNERKWL